MPQLHRLAGIVIALAVIIGLAEPLTRSVSTGRSGAVNATGPASTSVASPARGTASAFAPASDRAASAAASSADPAPAGTGATPGGAGASASAARQAKANEVGQVPVLMYHRILARPQDSLDRTPAELRAELERMAKAGYVPVTAAGFVGGRIDIPAGRHPVVLTFDDGHPSHFALDGNGRPKPDTAVGVIMDVARRHPGFRPVATFYINQEPFQLGEEAGAGLKWLVQNGFEIANHTFTHPDLSRLSMRAVQQDISRNEQQILLLTGAHAVTFAYPFGAVPKEPRWARRAEGKYDFQGVFLAGWKPSPSPFATEFDPQVIPRIRSEGKIKEDDCKRYCSAAWLDWLDKNSDKRYTSDGDPTVISFPRDAARHLGKKFAGQGRPY